MELHEEQSDSAQYDETAVGRYRLLRRIARGGMAEVYVGVASGASGFRKRVAIKRILPRYSSDPQFGNMLVDEAKITVLLTHPNIAQVLELGEWNDSYYIVMEYVSGPSLAVVLSRLRKAGRAMAWPQAVHVAIGVLDGLHAAHTQRAQDGNVAGIVHRDVSPQNVLISYDGNVKLIDFGIARARDRVEHTDTGTIKGKLRYLAPEMIDPERFTKSGDFDARADIFSTGIVLYEMLTAQPLFRGRGDLEVYEAICNQRVPNLTDEDIVDEELMSILEKSLHKHPDERYASAAEMADALRRYLNSNEPGFTPRHLADMMESLMPAERDSAARLELLDVEGKVSRGDDSDFESADPGISPGTEVTLISPFVPTDPSELDLTQTQTHPTRSQLDVAASAPTLVARRPQNTSVTAERPAPQRSRAAGFVAAILVGAFVAAMSVGLIETLSAVDDTVSEPVPESIVARFPVLVASSPQGARLSRTLDDGQSIELGTAPAVVMAAPDEVIRLSAHLDDHDDKTTTYTVPNDPAEARVFISLEATPVALLVKGAPAGAVVEVDRRPYARGMRVRPGKEIEVSVRHRDHLPFNTKQTPDVGKPLTVVVRLEAKPSPTTPSKPLRKGTLVITSAPYWGRVSIDGKPQSQTTPLRVKLPSGKHHIVVSHPPKGLVKSFDVTVLPGKTIRRTVAF